MTADRYSRSAIALHWAIALLLLFQLGLGWHMTSMPRSGTMFAAFQFHKSVGILVLALSLLRVGIRFLKPRPTPVSAGLLSGLLAKGVHLGLYALMIGGPLTGWVLVSTAKIAIPTRLFGAIPLPHLPLGEGWHKVAEQGHWLLAWIGITLIFLHLAGAIRHHVLTSARNDGEHENVIGRMIPLAADDMSDPRRIALALAAAGMLAATFLAPWLVYSATGSETPVQGPADRSPTVPVPSSPATAADATPQEAPTEDASSPPAEVGTPVPVNWRVMSGGRLNFTASMNGAAINGNFDRWSADITFGPEALENSHFVVSVPLLSATTADADRDQMLKGPSFFGSAGGTAVYRSTTIRKVLGNRYKANGTLTLNRKSHPVTLTFDLVTNGDKATVSGSSRLDRTTFGIGSGDWAATDQIAAQVDVTFNFSARRRK